MSFDTGYFMYFLLCKINRYLAEKKKESCVVFQQFNMFSKCPVALFTKGRNDFSHFPPNLWVGETFCNVKMSRELLVYKSTTSAL